ncbi:MAG: ZIP family metal transporter [Lachnospiraceae bacterium]
MVFFMRDKMNPQLEKLLLGFAAGVMIAASVWSLLIPAIELSEEQNIIGWVPAAVGFLLGIAFLLLLDSVIPHLHKDSDEPEGMKSGLARTTMLLFAVTLHNLPEGMAVGVTLAGAIMGNAGITMAGAFVLSLGIAIQNFPEGAIISMPLRSEGMSKQRAFMSGMLSGIVEPIGAIITILLAEMATKVLPYLLAFAAGAMIYVVVEELIPESQNGEHSNIGTVGAAFGFVLMMVLDVALG